VLHLYTPDRGRVGAVAKGVRRVGSRLGGRLEPLSRVRLVLHQGRGELCTVSQADTLHAHTALRERRASLERATQACEAVLRLLDSTESNRPAYNLLCNQLGLLDANAGAAGRAQALTFRLKLLLAAGFAPELAACAACGEVEHLGAFSPSAGGVVCAGCEAGSFPLGEEAHRFLVTALARPLVDSPQAPESALAQADRAIAETVEYHAHVRLRRVA
jgi:DNA repair protein RecO (recombination protein O)